MYLCLLFVISASLKHKLHTDRALCFISRHIPSTHTEPTQRGYPKHIFECVKVRMQSHISCLHSTFTQIFNQ